MLQLLALAPLLTGCASLDGGPPDHAGDTGSPVDTDPGDTAAPDTDDTATDDTDTDDTEETDTTPDSGPVDNDGDGSLVEHDCDDLNPDAYPGAAERCDGIDNDCDGASDEPDAVDAGTWYLVDADGDGAGHPASATVACDAPEGAFADADCDDTDATVFPGAPELCDGLPNDCDVSSTWTSADEDGLASMYDHIADTRIDVTASVTGAPGAAVSWEPAGDTTTTFCAGTFYVHARLMEDRTTLEGPYGADLTVLDGDASGSVVFVYGSGVTLEGLTLANGNTTSGAGLYNTGFTTVTDCVFRDNVAGQGAGIHNTRVVTVVDTTFEGNVASGSGAQGGGIYSSNTLTVQGCTFTDNTAEYGGGLLVATDYYAMSVEGSVFTGNTATYGGAIWTSGVELFTVTDTDLIGNTATYGGGWSIYGDGPVTVTGGTIAGNTATLGGGIYLHRSTLDGDGVTWGTGADPNDPGDIYATGTGADYVGSTGAFTCTGSEGC